MITNKVFNNDNMSRYIHTALSRQVKASGGGISEEEIQEMIAQSIADYEAAQLEEGISNNYGLLDYGEETYAYGVLIDFTEGKSSPDLTRIGNMELHRTLPVQSQYKGCIWNYNNKEILYYLNPENWNLAVNDTVNNVTKTATEVAADMQNVNYGIRVETPKFYASSKVLATDGAGHTTMAKVMFSTVKLNASYIEVPRQVTDFRNARYDSNLLSLTCNMAISGNQFGGYATTKNTNTGCTDAYLYPLTNWDRASARAAAQNIDTNLMCYEYYKWLFYWAFVIEYATLNSHKPINNGLDENGFHQGGLGGGLTNFVETNGINLQDKTGKDKCRYIGVTNELGNGTGELNIPTDTGLTKTGHPNRYRGFECPFGDVLLTLDGFLGRTVKDDNNNSIYEEYYTCSNPEKFGDDFPTSYSDDFESGWRIAYRDIFRDNTEREGYDDGLMMFANIGEQGDLFPQRWRTDYSNALYYVNYFYPVDGSDKTILCVGSYVDDVDSLRVGLGRFRAGYGLSLAVYYLGFRCFNIIKDDGTVI